MDSARRCRLGVSLTEVLIGAFIMAIVIFPSLSAIMSETRSVTGTREHSQAAFLGQRLIESARTYNFEKLPDFVNEYKTKSFTFNGVEYKVAGMALADIKTKDPGGKLAARKLSFSLKYTSQKHDLSLDLITIIARHE